jgi:hypothetical protein
MATQRFYFHPTDPPAVSPAYDASWDDTDGAARRQLLAAPFVGSGGSELVGVAEAAVGTKVMLGRQYVRAAPVGPLSGTLRAVLRCSANFAATSVDRVRLVVRVLSSDSVAPRFPPRRRWARAPCPGR